jgi:hypothetical protein
VNDYVPADVEDVEAPISANFVTGAGFDRAQITVRANDADQYVQRLAELTAVEALEKTVEFSRMLQEKAGGGAAEQPASNSRSTGSPSRSGGSSARGGASRPAPSDVEYHPEGLKCSKDDAPVIYKKIKSKAGKTFEMWVCENQRERGDGHHSEFIN